MRRRHSFCVIPVRFDVEGGDSKKVLKNINGNVLANEEFFDLRERIEFEFHVFDGEN